MLFTMRLSLLLLCLFCFVAFVACAPRWKRRAGAQELEEELIQYFPEYDDFNIVQEIMEDSRRRMIEEYNKLLYLLGAINEGPDSRNKTWLRKDKTEAGRNEKVDDFLLEGDIVPTVSLLYKMGITEDNDRIRRQVSQMSLWESGIVYYSISTEIKESSKHLAAVRAGIDFWHSHSCVDFREIVDEMVTNRIIFFMGLGCYSYIGRLGGPQGISIGEGCEHSGIVQHEIGHALGLVHQQSRADRGDYVEIMHSNIDPYSYINFHKYSLSTSQLSYLPYDYGSVMHFGPRNFAIDGNHPTIEPHDRRYQQVIDVAQINEAYECRRQCNFDYSHNIPSCNNGGIVDWRSDCSKCICPEGFGGSTCEEVEPSSDDNCGGTLNAMDDWSVVVFNASGIAKCVWHIRSSTGGEITMRIWNAHFEFPCDDGCMLGYVEVKVGPDYRATGPRSCDDDQASTLTYTTSVQPMIIIARSEETINVRFELYYKTT